uniref:Uncharacterized protein n=1 Tax=Mycolicibacterium sp. CBMA 213 TaxID=1968788 RepID=A0A343VRA9_9MYCO|nr:hypothetical protein B5P44_p00138 [Mycolicibacterium sp. CBMA 213]
MTNPETGSRTAIGKPPTENSSCSGVSYRSQRAIHDEARAAAVS